MPKLLLSKIWSKLVPETDGPMDLWTHLLTGVGQMGMNSCQCLGLISGTPVLVEYER
jgi:hypothetical protein